MLGLSVSSSIGNSFNMNAKVSDSFSVSSKRNCSFVPGHIQKEVTSYSCDLLGDHFLEASFDTCNKLVPQGPNFSRVNPISFVLAFSFVSIISSKLC
jgi:hypothetical protein